jgi:hypothetical protein
LNLPEHGKTISHNDNDDESRNNLGATRECGHGLDYLFLAKIIEKCKQEW